MTPDEKIYARFYQARRDAIRAKMNAFAYGHETLRQEPGIESMQMFKSLEGTKIVYVKLQTADVVSADFGEELGNTIRTITLTGPKSMIEVALSKDATDAIHIFTNSVRTICTIGDNAETYVDQSGSELGLTMFAPNYYEWFQQADWNTKVFVYIVTTNAMLPHYRRFFPHFMFLIQPDPSSLYIPYGSVGLTRMTTMTAAKSIGCKTAFFLDDTVFDMQGPDMTTINARNMLHTCRQLINIAKGDDIGYVGLCTGAFLGDSPWETTSKKNGFFQDEILPDGTKIRIFSSAPKDESLQTTTDFGDLSFVNQHRPNFIVVNMDNMRKNHINYNPVHTIGEDIYLTGRIVCKGLIIKQANYRFIRPGDDRRPKTCSSDGVCARESVMKTNAERDALRRKDTDVIFADFRMYNGRMMFVTENGIIGGAGVYGPVRVINDGVYADIQDRIILDTANKTCIDEYMGKLSTGVRFTHTNRFTYDDNIREAISKDGTKTCNAAGDSITCRQNFGLGSVQNSQLLPSTGMYKYIKDYEFIQSRLDEHLVNYYTNSTTAATGLRYDVVNPTWKSLLDNFLTKNKILPCLRNTRIIMHPTRDSDARKARYKLQQYFSTTLRLLRIEEIRRVNANARGGINEDAISRINAIMFSFGNQTDLCDSIGVDSGLFANTAKTDPLGLVKKINAAYMAVESYQGQGGATNRLPTCQLVKMTNAWVRTGSKIAVSSRNTRIVLRNNKTGRLGILRRKRGCSDRILVI